MIELKNLACYHASARIFGPISHVFPDRSLTAITGPNGAGKSTLLRAIAARHSQYTGRITAGNCALLPQSSTLDRSFPATVFDAVSMGAWQRIGAFRPLGAAERQRIDAALGEVALTGLADRSVGALSAGQFQRLLCARLIVEDHENILLDEPFTAVDPETRDALIALIRRWHGQGKTLLVVLHDLDIAKTFPDTLALQ